MKTCPGCLKSFRTHFNHPCRDGATMEVGRSYVFKFWKEAGIAVCWYRESHQDDTINEVMLERLEDITTNHSWKIPKDTPYSITLTQAKILMVFQ